MRFLFVSLFTLMSGGGLALAEPFDISAGYDKCLEQEPYQIGGAGVGDCFQDQSTAIDARIDTILHQQSKRYCVPEDRQRLQQAQSLWLEYRDTYCGLIADSPGNTPAYINAGACMLDAAQSRLDALDILVSHSYTWCNSLAFLEVASTYGPLSGSQGDTGQFTKASLSWRVSGDDDEQVLQIMASEQVSFALDVGECSYCQDGDCSMGAFLLAYPGPDAGKFEVSNAIMEDYALLHACRREEGVDVTLISGLLTNPEIALEKHGWPDFDWAINGASLGLSDRSGESAVWAAEP